MAQRFWEGLGYSVVNEFLSLFLKKDGYAKPSRYEVVIYPPTKSVTDGLLTSEIARKVSYFAETIVFPGRNLVIKEDISTYGPIREIVYGSTYEDVSATFYVATDHREQNFFHKWQDFAHNITDDTNEDSLGATKYYDDYISSVDIYQLDEKNTRRLGVRLIEAFPKTIGSIEMSYGSTNAIEKMSVSFSYRYWEIIGGDAASSFLKRLANIAINQTERKLIARLPKVLTRL